METQGKAKYVNISKLDAAKRQLEHAVKLFFRSGDVVVIHTLTGAAHQILRDLGKKQGIQSILYDVMMQYIKPEKRDYVYKLHSEAENFFKHADRDSDAQLKFYASQTEFYIWDACTVYARLTSEVISLFLLFQIWFYMKHNDILLDDAGKNSFARLAATFDIENRSKFLELLPEIEARLIK